MMWKNENLDPAIQSELEDLLSKNPALSKVLEQRPDPSVDRALRYLSLVPRFDESLYGSVFLPKDSGLPDFLTVVQDSDVERVPRTNNQFWLKETAQAHWLSDWEKQPEERTRWAKLVLSWLETHDGDPSTRLNLLFWIDSRQAVTFLENCYNKADSENDLLTCYALVEQVKENLPRVPAGQRPKFEEFLARYRARMLFLADFQRTAKYFPRPDLEKALDDVRASKDGKWILYMHAAGGMGKSMFIQRMIAHKLLKESPRALVVRLDLDTLSVSAIASAPWLIAIEIAHELDEQLTVPLFSGSPSSFYDTVKSFSSLLYRNASEHDQRFTEKEIQELTKLARSQFSIWYSFQARCQELPANQPLLIFIDTLEEGSLHFPEGIRTMLERFEELKRSVPQLRIILSGRMEPLPTHFAQYDDKLKKQTVFVSLTPFDPATSEAFVLQFLPDVTPDVAKAMAEASAGNPFKLSMLCEVVQEHPEMTASQLREYCDADVAYMIKRVIERIPVETELGLRWLLRYGSVPRRLTLSFVTEILHPLVIKALKGEVEPDAEDIPSGLERQTWLQNEAAQLDPSTLWNKLSKYSSEHSWISLDNTDPNTALLHPDVVKPMRRLLKDQKVYRYLHQAAASHFALLRSKKLGRWKELAAAELYHRLELNEVDLIKRTQSMFDERPMHGDARSRLELAEEILKPDGDFSEAPADVKAWAHYEAADAVAIMGGFRYLPEDDRKKKISSHLSAACELAGSTSLKLPTFIWRWREFLESNSPNTRSAVFELIFASSEYRVRYWLLILDLFGRLGIAPFVIDCIYYLFSDAEWLIRSTRIPAWVFKDRFAASLFRQGNYKKGCKILRLLLEGPALKDYVADTIRVRSRLIKGLVRSLNLREAELELSRFSTEGQFADDRWAFQSDINLLRRDSWAALDCAEKMANHHNFRYHLLKGTAFGQLLRIDDAMQAFSKARQACIQGGDLIYADLVDLRELQFRLFEAGLPTNPVTRQAIEVGGTTPWQIELELVRAYQLRAISEQAAPILGSLSSERFSRDVRIRSLLAGLCWGLLPSSAMMQLESLLAPIHPVGARLDLLRPPVLLGQAWKLSRHSIHSINMMRVGDTGAGGVDKLLFAGLLRALNLDRDSAASLAKITVSAQPSKAELALFRQRRLIEKNADPDPVETWEELRTEPCLYAAALIENAERAVAQGNFSLGSTSLYLARTALQEAKAHPLLQERYETASRLLITRMGPVFDDPPREVPRMAQIRHEEQGHSSFMVSIDHGRVSVSGFGSPRARIVSTVDNESLRVLATNARERTPKRLAFEMSKRWSEVIEELREPFRGSIWNPFDPNVHMTPFGLSLFGSQLVATPWELVFPTDVWPVRLGSIDDPTRKSFDDFAWRERARPTIQSVAICSPFRGFDVTSKYMFLLEESYKRFGVHVGIQPELSGVVGEFQNEDIIHLVTPLEDSASLLTPHLWGSEWTGEGLGRLLRRRGSRPFVILDVPGAHSVTECIEQIFARNQFAQALLNSGSVQGVLATGLNDIQQELPEVVEPLVESIFGSATLAAVPAALRKHFSLRNETQVDLRRMLGPMGTAMFVDTQSNPPWA